MTEPANRPEESGRRATIFAVTSGKGGVGKTSLSVNLACEFSRRGHRTIIVDTDLGLANAHILAGIRPTRTLSDYVEGKAELAEIVETGPCKVKFISGGSGVKAMANLDDNGRARICVAIEELTPFCDVVVLDTGAGVSKGVTDFVAMADQAIVVTTSNFAAIADAYGIVKVVVQDGYRNPIHCVVNRVRSPEEAEQVFLKLKGCTERFLGFDLNWLGLLPEDTSVEGAVLKRAPFSEVYPGSVAARYLAKLASSLEKHLGAPQPAAQVAKS
ncbi:MAG: MinD/ParA family protein [Planctomycetes bacterium]|nr:MinD/ParA family protein [Planctomycetota bacterium]